MLVSGFHTAKVHSEASYITKDCGLHNFVNKS